MVCEHCKARDGTYDMNKVCCAARYADLQLESVCRKYGHKRADIVAAMREQAQAKRVTK